MTASTGLIGRPRAVTRDEVEHYRQNGWVHLPGLVASDTVEAILESVKASAVKKQEELRNDMGGMGEIDDIDLTKMYQHFEYPSADDRELFAFTRSPEIGAVVADLIGSPVRVLTDQIHLKMPVSTSAASGITPWHQDFPYLQFFDRSVNHTIWLALVDVPPERGSMRFLNGSHRSGVFGRALHDQHVSERLAHLQDEGYPISDPLDMKAGDATVHHTLTVHYSPPNGTDVPRWAYLLQMFAADALYTGYESAFIADRASDLRPNRAFDEKGFPVIGTPSEVGHI